MKAPFAVLLIVSALLPRPAVAHTLPLCCNAYLALFASTDEPNLPPEPIGASDLIHLTINNSPELSQSFRVDGKGMLNLPLLRMPVFAQGMMPSELGSKIAAELRAQHLLRQPVVVVSVVEYLSRSVTVDGAVSTPVTIRGLDDLRLTAVLTKAGGLLPQAGPEIIVRQTDGSEQRIEVPMLLSGLHPELDVRIAAGAVITVPEAELVYVVGDTSHPGAFPLVNGEDTTVLQLLASIGGIGANRRSSAYVYRKDPRSIVSKEIQVPLGRILEGTAPDIKLAAGDILYLSSHGK